jgi:hypothetical protein
MTHPDIVARTGSGPGGRRFKSSLPDQSFSVRSGDIGSRTFRRHKLHFWAEGIFQRLQDFGLQIEVAPIILHKADGPDIIVNLLDDDLSGTALADMNSLKVAGLDALDANARAKSLETESLPRLNQACAEAESTPLSMRMLFRQ